MTYHAISSASLCRAIDLSPEPTLNNPIASCFLKSQNFISPDRLKRSTTKIILFYTHIHTCTSNIAIATAQLNESYWLEIFFICPQSPGISHVRCAHNCRRIEMNLRFSVLRQKQNSHRIYEIIVNDQ